MMAWIGSQMPNESPEDRYEALRRRFQNQKRTERRKVADAREGEENVKTQSCRPSKTKEIKGKLEEMSD